MKFTDLNLNTSLLNALNDLGYITPTTIQQKVFSIAMSGRDICGIAQTGTGKTFAYLLPLLKQWKFSKKPTPQILILVPTRELVQQVVEAAEQLTTYTNTLTYGVYGGVNMNPQRAAVENGLDILVATPGRLFDLVMSGSLKLKDVKKLVLDEMDEMLNLGFRKQITSILELLPERRQNLLFSATITPEVEEIMNAYFNTPELVEAAPTGTPLENIEQIGFDVPNFNTKVNLLKHMLQQDESMTKVLIFAATKKMADLLHDELTEAFPEKIGIIHSNKDQRHRFNTIRHFKSGEYPYIIATDIVARGLDIAEVTHVINFDTPDEPENYIHRIGRTGRADKKGIAITFTTEKELENKEQIEALMKYQIPIQALPEDVAISSVLIDDELPKVFMRELSNKIVKREDGGGAFHEKKAKNQKVNKKISRKEEMQMKYGKPLKRGAKPKRKK